jgi:hypothetical protein
MKPVSDIADPLRDLRVPVRVVTAVTRFLAGPGREREAAEAWFFELRYFFLRGPAEAPPVVTYAGGVYTCTGQMTTTHPGDGNPTVFDSGEPWDLKSCEDPARRAMLREIHPREEYRFDGVVG